MRFGFFRNNFICRNVRRITSAATVKIIIRQKFIAGRLIQNIQFFGGRFQIIVKRNAG